MVFERITTNLEAGHAIAVGVTTVGAFEDCSIVRHGTFTVWADHSLLRVFVGCSHNFFVACCALIDSADLNAFEDDLLREKVSSTLDAVWCLVTPHEWFAHLPPPQ